VKRQEILLLWEHHHGVLSPVLRESFLRRTQLDVIIEYPDKEIARCLPINPKLNVLIDNLRRGLIERFLKEDEVPEPPDAGEDSEPPDAGEQHMEGPYDGRTDYYGFTDDEDDEDTSDTKGDLEDFSGPDFSGLNQFGRILKDSE